MWLLLLFSCKSLQEWATDCKETMVDDSNDGEAPASSSDGLFADYDPVTQYPPPGFKWWHSELVPLTPEESQLLKEHLHPESVKKWKSGWQNRCVLMLALYNKGRWKELDRICTLFTGHHSTGFQVLCLESAIQKWGDAGPKKCGYPW